MTSRRFTDADKWEDAWFGELPPEAKLFWIYLCDRCDLAGVWEPNQRLVTFHLNLSAPLDQAMGWFGDRVELLPNGKWRLVKFIIFQQPKGLVECRSHLYIVRLLRQHGAIEAAEFFQSQITNSMARGREGVANPLARGASQSLSQGHGQSHPSPPVSSSSSGSVSKRPPTKADFVRGLLRRTLAAETEPLVEQWIGVAIKAGAPGDSKGPIDWTLRMERVDRCYVIAKEVNGACRFPSQAEPFARQVRAEFSEKATA